MRRSHLGLGLIVGVVGIALPSAAQAASTSFSGTLLVHQPLKVTQSFPCSGPGICGEGILHGLGRVQVSIEEEEFTEIEGTDCFTVLRLETVTVLDGSGTIGLESTGTGCAPGRSLGAGGEKSFGHPFISDLTFTINGEHSTGAYQGATGSGTDRFKFAGATGVWMLTGTITTG